MTLEPRYAWLGREPGPHMLLQMLALTGVHEFSGGANNPIIIAWAEECGFKGYVEDATPWCGLCCAIAAKRAGWEFNPGGNALWARNWADWGNPACPAGQTETRSAN
jgi:hypothetical protein